jgi:hypothetical protein
MSTRRAQCVPFGQQAQSAREREQALVPLASIACPAVEPAGDLNRAEIQQPRGFRVEVVGLDVDVKRGASSIDCTASTRSGSAPGSEVNCSSFGTGRAGTPGAADQKFAAAAASSECASIRIVENRLRCIAER